MDIIVKTEEELEVALEELAEAALLNTDEQQKIFDYLRQKNYDPDEIRAVVVQEKTVAEDLRQYANEIGNDVQFFKYLMGGGSAAAAVPVSVVFAKGASEIAVFVSLGVGGMGFCTAGYTLYKVRQFSNRKVAVETMISKVEILIAEIEKLREGKN